jgi:phage terminase Nu1 subunit (DNA packaging protein)
MTSKKVPDISQPRMVDLAEVAILFDRSPATVKKQVQHGLFPVEPRQKGKGVDLLWSSADLQRYFVDPKAGAAKRGTKAGAR